MSFALPLLSNLQSNKTAFQLFIYLLSEWNELEIKQISQKRGLLAHLTLLWDRLPNIPSQLVQLWRKLIGELSQELTFRWKEALSLRQEYGKALDQMSNHLKSQDVPCEARLNVALHTTMEARKAAVKVLQQKPSSDWSTRSGESGISGSKGMIGLVRRDSKFSQKDGSHSLARVGESACFGSRERYWKERNELFPDITYRQNVAHLNTLRQEFVRDATPAYRTLVEQQHDVASAMKRCLTRHAVSQNHIAIQTSRSNSHLTSAIDNFLCIDLIAPLHERLPRDLHLPQYSLLHYIDPRDGEARRAVLFGVSPQEGDMGKEGNNSILPVLLEATRRGFQVEYPKKKGSGDGEIMTLVRYFESNWLSSFEDNVGMIGRRPFGVRHSLVMFYLSCLPDPLLPMSSNDITQYALKRTSVRMMLSRLPLANVVLLRDLCGYVHRLEQYDRSVIKRFGKLIMRRANSDLIGDGSNEKMIEDIVRRLIRHFRKEKERTVLDISPVLPEEPEWMD
ncbi:hypothetical protein FRC15_004167 [Serendipita sp. 397]|nr:hypothetical protein FRC15_004167 [Serendipita sp. 397]